MIRLTWLAQKLPDLDSLVKQEVTRGYEHAGHMCPNGDDFFYLLTRPIPALFILYLTYAN